MASLTPDVQFMDVLAAFGAASFSTSEFIDKLKDRYPKRWKAIENEYGAGGKGSGRYYTSSAYTAHVLNEIWKAGDLSKLDYRKAPKGWGNPQIRYWTASREKSGGTLYPDEVPEDHYDEGHKTRIFVNRYERNPKARLRCIERYGLICTVCKINFEETYGPHGAGFIHVHHLVPVHTKGDRPHRVDPIKDLRPVCPNCHAMIHYKKEMLTIEKARSIYIRQSKFDS